MSDLLAVLDNHPEYESDLIEALLSFRCAKDSDIETFLHDKAIEFNRRRICVTYLLFNKAAYDEGKMFIDAFFTLSYRSIVASNVEAGKSAIKKIGGFATVKTLDFILIGQLGKYIKKISDDEYLSADISGERILDYAFQTIRRSTEIIPCRCALIECKPIDKVRKVYTDYDFKFFQHDGKHDQLYKVIPI